jgi:hypothetical protein
MESIMDSFNFSEEPDPQPESAKPKPNLFIRAGRGRTGGSTGLDLAIQRARFQGRRVKPLDGDRRSKTLSTLYPAVNDRGEPVQDGASAPLSDELPDIKKWLSGEFDAMVEDEVSRALDLSGGDRVMQEFVRDLALNEFCQDYGITPTVALFLGPDIEDFRHATEILRSGEFPSARTILVLNEGVIRHGQTPEGAFDPIMDMPEFDELIDAGVRTLFLRRLTCMAALRERGLGFFDAVSGKPDSKGAKASPTLAHMTKTWLATFEREISESKLVGWLP